jgi:dihydroxy-acid dehydratase
MSDKKRLRSQAWFDDPHDPGMTALYLERFLNYGLTLAELRSGRPIIGIAQSGSDIVPCNRHHIQLAQRVRDGIRDAGGVPFEFPTFPLQETGIRPTAALHRNLAAMTLQEILRCYPLDGVVLTTGCDKTTPSSLMAAASVNLPAIVLSGGPMLNGYYVDQATGQERLAGSGAIIWYARQLMAQGQIDGDRFMEMAARSAPSAGHCNTMGTALSMNCLAEALGMSLPTCASIPGPHAERPAIAYETGLRIVNLVRQDIKPSDILTKAAFENAIAVAAAIGASSNCPPHLIAMARHAGVSLSLEDFQRVGADIPLLVNCQPAGLYLGEEFHRAGGVPAVVHALMQAGQIHPDTMTVSGESIGQIAASRPSAKPEVITSYDKPLREAAGFSLLSGNLFDAGIMKMSVVDDAFRARYLSTPGAENTCELRAIVFEGPEDYHARINDPALAINQNCMLVIRNCGPIGYPGSAEVVNMQPPDYLLKQGITSLPTMGDGRQSGTSAAPSILNISPEAQAGGNLALLRTSDTIRLDLNTRRVDVLISNEEMTERRAAHVDKPPQDCSPWETIYRQTAGQLSTGGCMELAANCLAPVCERDGSHIADLLAQRVGMGQVPRHSH